MIPMKTSLLSKTSRLGRSLNLTALVSASVVALATFTAKAADIHWTNGIASYTNALDWDSNTVPTATDNALSDHGLGTVVQINAGNPDWAVNDLRAGAEANTSGAIEQNGQTVTVNSWLILGDGTNSTGIFTLNAGTVNIPNGRLFLGGGPDSTTTLNINGGVINKTGGDPFVVADGGWNGQVSRTGTVNQVNGTINCGSEIWIGQSGDGTGIGTGIYNLHGGTINASNWFALGRSGGNGTLIMDGGVINKSGNGNVLVGTGFATPAGGSGVAELDQSGGTINCGQQFLVPENSPSSGTYKISGTAVLNLNDWIAIGRNGGTGELDVSGGAAITHNGGGNFDVAGGGPGTVNQTGGAVTNASGQTWIGENSTATWNLNSGIANLGTVHIAQTSSGNGTLNVNGGTLLAAEITTGNSGGFSSLNLNGGAIIALNDNPNFLHDLSQALVGPGGAIFDSQGFNITASQSLLDNGGGGLTKNGAGTLTLSGANGYTGPTVVNAGTLATTTASTGGGSYSVANGAGLGVGVASANGQLTASSVTLASSTAATLDFDLAAFGNPTSAPLNVTGTFAVNGTITVNIADALPQVGQFPLVQFATRTGAGSFVLGTIPVGIVANIVTNLGTSTIDLHITSVNLPRWDGQAGGNWDIGLTTNWINIGTGLPTFYGEGNFVLFDDNALGTNVINLVTTVNPGSVTANNSALNYTLVGTGKISGPTHLNKQGTGTFAIANTGGNNYTGPTLISGGTLSVSNLANGGSPSAIGAASASPTNLVLANATLSYSGPPVTANRGFTIASTNSAIDAESNFALSGRVTAIPNPGIGSAFVKTGPAQFALTAVGTNEFANGYNPGIKVNMGTMLFDGSAGGQTNHTVNEMWVGGTPASGASLILSNTTLNVDSWIGVGRGNGTIGNTSSVTLYNSTLHVGNVSLGYDNGIAGNTAFQFLTLNGSSTLTNNGNDNFCESAGSTATIAINGTSLFWGQNAGFLPNNGGATGVVTIANSGRMVINNGWFSIGNGNNGSGSVFLKDSASLFVSGDFNVTDTGTSVGSIALQDNAVASGNTFLVAKNGGTVGNVTLSGGTVIARSGDTQIGGSGSGTMTQTGGTLFGTNWISIGRNTGGVGVYNLSGGSLVKVNVNGTRLNVAENGTGTLNVSGSGSVVVGVGGFADLDICSASGNGTVNLNGGTITAGQVTHLGGGTATFNFNGGTLIASTAANANFMNGLTAANVMSGGAIIDSGAGTINIGQALLDGGGGGGLTKLGTGALRLDGVNTYTGTTLVSAGALGGNGTIAGPVNVAASGTLAPGIGLTIGTLTVNNSVTLGGTTVMELSKNGGVTTNDLLVVSGNLAFGGTLTVALTGTNALAFNDTFTLFTWGTRSGSFAVTNLPAGYFWDTSQLNVNGSIRVIGVTPPKVNPVMVAGGKLILTGLGGPPAGTYTWLTATNAATPLTNWTTNVTGVFDGSGGFSNAIPINTSERARFFRLRTP